MAVVAWLTMVSSTYIVSLVSGRNTRERRSHAYPSPHSLDRSRPIGLAYFRDGEDGKEGTQRLVCTDTATVVASIVWKHGSATTKKHQLRRALIALFIPDPDGVSATAPWDHHTNLFLYFATS